MVHYFKSVYDFLRRKKETFEKTEIREVINFCICNPHPHNSNWIAKIILPSIFAT